MPLWKDLLRADPLPWLLEEDGANPGVRYVALSDLLDLPESDPQVRRAQAAVMATGPVPAILAAPQEEGYWVKPGPGYSPKYTSTVWQIIFLAQLGADAADPGVRAGCEYALKRYGAAHGGISPTGAPGLFVHCMSGLLAKALIDFGWLGHRRLQRALQWQARAIVGAGVAGVEAKGTAEKYYKAGTTGPGFACAVNLGLPCAWGGVKALLGLSRVPEGRRSPAMDEALRLGAAFLLSKDPAVADYPFGVGKKPNPLWFKLGYPTGYVSNVLENLEALAALGSGGDPRLQKAVELVLGKQDAHGRWKLEHTYNGKMWADVEQRGQPSKWVTLRVLRVLKVLGYTADRKAEG